MSDSLSTPSADIRSSAQLEPLSRCCASHPDYPTLSEHLLTEFTELTIDDVVREVGRAKEAVEATGMSGAEALETAELIARHQLMLLAGRVGDIARLNPERHLRRPKDEAEAAAVHG